MKNNQKKPVEEAFTAVIHGDLISFLNENTFDLLHTEYTPHNIDLLNGTTKIIDESDAAFLNYLARKGISCKNKDSNCCRLLQYPQSVVSHLLVVLSNRCNMSCRYCYTEANEHPDETEVSGDDWIEIFNSIKIPNSDRIQNISFTGGEPTLHPDFPQILRKLSGRYKIEISTNGFEMSDGSWHSCYFK